MKLLRNDVFENLSPSQKKEYYEKLREQCLLIRNNQFRFGQNVIKNVYPFLRQYKLEIEGEENVPKDSNALFLWFVVRRIIYYSDFYVICEKL